MKPTIDTETGRAEAETPFEKIFGFAPGTALKKGEDRPQTDTATILIVLENYALLYAKCAAEFPLFSDENDPRWELRARSMRLKYAAFIKYYRGMEAAKAGGYPIKPRAIGSWSK